MHRGSQFKTFFHLHLVSDATGETLISVAKAASAQFRNATPIEHVYALVRSDRLLDAAIAEMAAAPGVVLYTLVDPALRERLEAACQQLGYPCVAVLEPVFAMFARYLGDVAASTPGVQHRLDAEYFARIDALNFTMAHDDGALPTDMETADVVLVGVSRTSKTPTSIYLANRGVKTTNVAILPGVPLPEALSTARRPLIVGLVASPERLIQVRTNRLMALSQDMESAYVDPTQVRREVTDARRLFEARGWPVIDVTRRSVEETAAAILNLLHERELRASWKLA